MANPRKIIIDVDTGVDDAQAIMLALANPDVVEVLAITCVHGNIDIENVCRNTLRVLNACDRLDIPVYRGCCKTLVHKNAITSSHVHGDDGMGGITDHEPVDMSLIQSEPATLALLRLVNQFPGEISLVACAPLTNIAVALRLDPDLGKKLKDVMIMGGNIHGRGNTAPAAEFNFRSDPEAAYVVLRELGCPILITPWETCIDQGQPWEWFEDWVATETKKGKFVHKIVQYIVHRIRHVSKRPFYTCCDLLAMAIVIDSRIAVKTTELYGEVELMGSHTRGQLVCDWRLRLGHPCNVYVVESVDLERARQLYNKMLL